MSSSEAVDSVFVDAAACGDYDEISRLLAEYTTPQEVVNAMDKDGRTSFHYACLNDDIKLLNMLLADDRVDILKVSPRGDTGMHLASLYACQEVLKVLFKDDRTKGMLNQQNNWGESPLHLCAGSGDKGATKAAKLLLKEGASIYISDQWKRGPLDVARAHAENALVEVFEDFLKTADDETNAKVKAQTAEYWKDLMVPVHIKEEDIATKSNLLGAGILGGAMKALKKVNVNEKSLFKKTEGKITNKSKKAIVSNDKRRILSKLIDFPGDKDEIAGFLIDPEVNSGGADAFGLTALHKFASWNKIELMEMIMEHLTDEQVNAQDPDGKTALHWACEMGSVNAVRALAKSGRADIEIKDNKGRTPMGILEGGGNENLIKRLGEALKGR